MEVENLVTHSLYETERSTLSSICSVKVKKRIKVVRVKGEEEGESMQSDQGLPTSSDKGILEFNRKNALSIPNRISKR